MDAWNLHEIAQLVGRRGALLIPRMLAGAIVFAGFWAASIAAVRITRHLLRHLPDDRQDLVELFGRTARVSLLILGVVSGLGTMGVNVSALVAGLGLTGFAMGFALRDALSNLLAGVLIMIYRPFRRGDRIEVTGFTGTVIEINLRYTWLRMKDSTVLIPNGTLFTNPIRLLETAPPPPES